MKKKEILKIASKRDVDVQQEASILYVILYKYIHIHIIQIQATEKCNYICVWKFCAFFSFASPFSALLHYNVRCTEQSAALRLRLGFCRQRQPCRRISFGDIAKY